MNDAIYAIGAAWEDIVQRPATHAELYVMGMYQWDRVPTDMVIQAMQRAYEAVPEHKRLKVRLSWLVGDVNETVAAWKRAVGPSYGSGRDRRS